MKSLKDIRLEINKIDADMRDLFKKRMSAVKEVAEYKKANGLPILDKEREALIIENNVCALEDEELRPFYATYLNNLMAVSRSYQDMLINGMRIAYSGVAGAFAYIAARKLFPYGQYISYPNFESAYNACLEGECDLCILPIENSVGGEVGQVTDLMFSSNLKVNEVVEIDINHCLLGTTDAKISDVKKVISHPQALAQCRSYIKEHSFEEEEFENTALAAEQVLKLNDKSCAAIASEEAAQLFGLQIIEKNINQSNTNTTRFAVFSRSEHKRDKNENGVHSILLFTVKNEAGALAKALDIIGKHGFNLKLLRSRPMKSLMWQYYFYVEAEGNINTKGGERLMEDLDEFCERVKLLGTYVKIPQ